MNVAGAKSGAVNEATVTGGGAPAATARQPLTVSDAPTPFGVSTYEMRAEEEGGATDTQAGSHPFQFTTGIWFNETLDAEPAGGMAKDLHFNLPPGVIGDPIPVPQCAIAEFLASQYGETVRPRPC